MANSTPCAPPNSNATWKRAASARQLLAPPSRCAPLFSARSSMKRPRQTCARRFAPSLKFPHLLQPVRRSPPGNGLPRPPSFSLLAEWRGLPYLTAARRSEEHTSELQSHHDLV